MVKRPAINLINQMEIILAGLQGGALILLFLSPVLMCAGLYDTPHMTSRTYDFTGQTRKIMSTWPCSSLSAGWGPVCIGHRCVSRGFLSFSDDLLFHIFLTLEGAATGARRRPMFHSAHKHRDLPCPQIAATPPFALPAQWCTLVFWRRPSFIGGLHHLSPAKTSASTSQLFAFAACKKGLSLISVLQSCKSPPPLEYSFLIIPSMG